MSDSEQDRVLIAGGGIAGLAMRRALHRRGIPSQTLEQRVEATDGGLAINLPGNAVQALGQLGLAERSGRDQVDYSCSSPSIAARSTAGSQSARL